MDKPSSKGVVIFDPLHRLQAGASVAHRDDQAIFSIDDILVSAPGAGYDNGNTL